MRRLSWLILLAGCPHPAPVVTAPATLPDDPAACFAAVDKALSDDALEGRGVGTPGLDTAVGLVEDWYKGLGLQAPERGYRQKFDVLVGVSTGPGNKLYDTTERVVDRDFTPLGFSRSGPFSGRVVFAGYGITAPEKSYDDYAGIDARGKVVLAMRYEPGENDPN